MPLFQARCGRVEYWATVLVLLSLAFAAPRWPLAACLGYGLATWLLAARRLRDIGWRGRWALVLPAKAVVAAAFVVATGASEAGILGLDALLTLTIIFALGLPPNKAGPDRSRHAQSAVDPAGNKP